MNVPLELTGLTKVFPTPTGPFIAVKDVNADRGRRVRRHPRPLRLRQVDGAVDDRRPRAGDLRRRRHRRHRGHRARRRARHGLSVAVPAAVAHRAPERAGRRGAGRERRTRRETLDAARHYLDLVGVGDAAEQLPPQLSLGTQQCVSLARALSVEPRFLLLDEPFSMLDSLTRFELQDMLLRVWEESGKTVVMVTHDVDEALYLADRLMLMTDGPEATVGDVLRVPFPRPRARAAVLAHPEYHACRRHVIDFLEHHAHQSRPERARRSAAPSAVRS